MFHYTRVHLEVSSSPCARSHGRFQSVGVADHLVKDADYLLEFGTLCSVFLPAVQHQLMKAWGTVHGSWQAVALLYGLDDLGVQARVTSTALRLLSNLVYGLEKE